MSLSNRKIKIHRHTCIDCGEIELLKYPTYWYRVNKGTNKCSICSKKGLGTFKPGMVPWNKGKKGYGRWAKWYPRGSQNPFAGKKHTDETLKKLRIVKLGHYGELANNWQGGKTDERRTLMGRDIYKQLRKRVFERDNYTCRVCNLRGGKLEIDHIKEWRNYPELRFDDSNCRTLCKDCHLQTNNHGYLAIKKGQCNG